MKNRILGIAARAAKAVGDAARQIINRSKRIEYSIEEREHEPPRRKHGKGRGRRPHGRGKFKPRTRGNLGPKRGPTPQKHFR